ncbi:hypothetical protein LTS17_005289 [Exophiala oligosperma]
MTVVGALLVLVGLFTLSLSTAYYQIFLSQGVCIGVGGGLLYVPSLALVSTSFKKRRALALGTLTCGIGIGGVVYVAVFQSLLPRVGFAWTVRVLSFIATAIFGLAVPILLFSGPKTQRASSTRKLFDKTALQDLPFMVYSLASFIIFLGYLVPFFYIPSYAEVVLETRESTGFWALAVASATSIVGRLGSALLAQRVGIMVSWVTCSAISATLCLCWIAVRNIPALYAFCALYVFPKICKDPNQLGTWMGMGWFASGISFLIGAPIAGVLIKINTAGHDGYNFLAVQLMSGLLLGAGTICLLVLWALLVKTRGERLLV